MTTIRFLVRNKNKKIVEQAKSLFRAFPRATIKTRNDQYLEFQTSLRPSPIGREYKIRIIAHLGVKLEIFVIEPKKLLLANGKTKLPHVYNSKTQKLCLFYPAYYEWSFKKFISNTIIPWTMEWLFYYEIWVATGEWLGGGIEH